VVDCSRQMEWQHGSCVYRFIPVVNETCLGILIPGKSHSQFSTGQSWVSLETVDRLPACYGVLCKVLCDSLFGM